MTIKIDIERTGFPVNIGKLELWFDSSIENLVNFLNAEQIALDKLKKAQEDAKHYHFPAEVNVETVKNIDEKTINAAFDVNKEFIAAQYDVVFGDGTFSKIYKEYPDIMALENALNPLTLAISKRIEEQEEERLAEVEKIKNEALNKKSEKSR